MAEKDPRTVVLKNVRLSYANIYTPKSINGSDPKYSASIMIPKDNEESIEDVETAIDAAKEYGAENVKGWGGKIPKKLKDTLHDGDDRDDEDPNYEGFMYLTATSKKQPELVNKHGDPIMDNSEIYSGCWVNVVLRFYAYDSQSKGVAVELGPIQKVKDDTAFSGGMGSAKDYFKPIKSGKKSSMLD